MSARSVILVAPLVLLAFPARAVQPLEVFVAAARGVGFTWSFDLTSVANIRSGDASAAAAQAQQTRTSLDAGDAIHRYWQTVRAGIAQSRSARAGRDAAVHASEQAHVQYLAGTATQLDLLQAQRDAFAAEVTRIQDDANLMNARGQLRIAIGRSLER